MPSYGSDWGRCHSYLPVNITKPVPQYHKGRPTLLSITSHQRLLASYWLRMKGWVAWVLRSLEEHSLTFLFSRGQQNPHHCSPSAGQPCVSHHTTVCKSCQRAKKLWEPFFPLALFFKGKNHIQTLQQFSLKITFGPTKHLVSKWGIQEVSSSL